MRDFTWKRAVMRRGHHASEAGIVQRISHWRISKLPTVGQGLHLAKILSGMRVIFQGC